MEPKDDIKPFAMQGHAAVDKAANVATDAISATEHHADHATHKVASKIEEAALQLKPVMENTSEVLDSAMQKVRAALHDASDQLRTQTQKASDLAVDYTKAEPLKAVLLAAATGALLMGMVTMMARSRE